MKIIMHSPLHPDECRKRIREAVQAPSWLRYLGSGRYPHYQRLEDTPILGWATKDGFHLELYEYLSRGCKWACRLDFDEKQGGTLVKLIIIIDVAFISISIIALVIAGLLLAISLGNKTVCKADPNFWVFAFFFVSALTLIIIIQQQRSAKALTMFLKRVLEASEISH